MGMIKILWTASGKEYKVGKLQRGHYQYMDRQYQFDYVPKELDGCDHIMTCGRGKMISEQLPTFSFYTDTSVMVYILYPDKQPILPSWLKEFERMRWNVTRMDSQANNLKGYFSVFRKKYNAGEIVLGGNSPEVMLKEEEYVETRGAGYCMYTVAVHSVKE